MSDAVRPVEELAAQFHDIYQQEAKRQGDVRHKDAYTELPENVKEFDRVLARHACKLQAQARLEEHKRVCRTCVNSLTSLCARGRELEAQANP